MRAKFGRTVRAVGVALVLASGAGVVLGTVPASAVEYKFKAFVLGYHGDQFPSRADAINETRPQADQWCVHEYGFRARGVEPGSLFGVRNANGTNDWKQSWYCYPN